MSFNALKKGVIKEIEVELAQLSLLQMFGKGKFKPSKENVISLESMNLNPKINRLCSRLRYLCRPGSGKRYQDPQLKAGMERTLADL